MSGDRGSATLELAVILPLLGLLAFAALPLFSDLLAVGDLHRAAEDGVRFATKVERNPATCEQRHPGPIPSIPGSTPPCDVPGCDDELGVPTRRRSRAEVISRVMERSDGRITTTSGSVAVLVTGSPTTSPCTVRSGATIEVIATWERQISPLESLANAFTRVVGGDDLFDMRTRSVSAYGRLE